MPDETTTVLSPDNSTDQAHALFFMHDRVSTPAHNSADSISIALARLSVASGLNYCDRYKLFILPNQNWRPS
ncbi:hypothetical protein A1351_13725 [Methylosinus sp. R-45379]|uniref:hypothetical protein n=1 Tax=Methylosinus sp. R-45379 TaxID=980563 RepID=UPI0007C8E816|nr:hypothetical protein [Methylosinus sp. R-45379]OAI27296.1 hypothetical protein A1351_13725 [Methylosinus sp. R-45379]